jgi:hypothetical protein
VKTSTPPSVLKTGGGVEINARALSKELTGMDRIDRIRKDMKSA